MTFLLTISFLAVACTDNNKNVGKTEITKWQYGKNGAVSITYDDGSINQFRKALPLMNALDMPGTFFINTGQIPGSLYEGKFIGRPVKDIITESATVTVNKDNFFERASAARFLGYKGTSEYHTRAGSAYDAGKTEEAYKIIEELYKKVRNGEFKRESVNKPSQDIEKVTWDEVRAFAKEGHEFASHMVTHPYMAVLDEPNMLYELEKSRDEIKDQLGPEYTFSAECPYGTENERVMEYAHKVYPALRNRMPESFLEELNRSSKASPTASDKEYVQWQRGATTKTPLPMMKSWIDTTAYNDNIWLVLVIHGVDGAGWEALQSEMLEEYFGYLKSKDLWTATFGDVARYIRERENSHVEANVAKKSIVVSLSHTLDKEMYKLPLTLKTYVPSNWVEVSIKTGDFVAKVQTLQDGKGRYVLYQANPDGSSVELSGI